MEQRWRIINSAQPKTVPEVIEELLRNREIGDPQSFFTPPRPSVLLDNLAMYLPDLKEKELGKAVRRIKSALRKKEKIVVWGDYDVDGIASTAILWRVLWNLGADVAPYIPDRFKEGYGLNKEGITQLAKKGVGLVITVDSGVTAVEEIKLAKKLGLDVVITDHHLKPKKLPSADALVHSTYLCGAGLAWILAAQLTSFSQVQKELDLVAVATIADLQPVTGANRILLKEGFAVLSRLGRPGLSALAESAGLRPGNLGSYAVGWVLGPRINAVGRIGDGMEALRLLCTPSPVKARGLAQVLGAANLERKEITKKMVEEARLQIEPDGLILVYEDGWHEGVIGLVAGTLVREFGRPAIVVSRGEKFSKGSARSAGNLNIVEALRKYSAYFTDLGGHSGAAGFTIPTENLAGFADKAKAGLKKVVAGLDSRPTLKADLRLPLSLLTYELAGALADFEPTGIGNPAPVFLAEGTAVLAARKLGKEGQHLLLNLDPGLEAIWFGAGEKEFTRGQKVSFLYSPEINSYRGKERLSLKVQDLRAV